MAFKTLLASLNNISRTETVVTTGVRLAREFDAHITGLYAIPAVEVYALSGFESPPIVFEGRRDQFKKEEASVRSAFEAIISKEGVRGEFRILELASPNISDAIIEHGRVADLIILSQMDSTVASMVDGDMVERISISVGRPTLVIPDKGRTQLSCDLAIIAWNGSREAARAAFDSLPLLKRSKEVRIVWVDPQMDLSEAGVLPGAELAESLSRHGINAVAEALPSGRDVGEALLTKVSDTGAGLLVMGAYGHTRLREFILGGATRSVLRDMNCPVFFSH